MNKPKITLDVESMGLHGVGFVVGAVVKIDGKEVDSLYAACPHENLPCDPDDRAWLEQHVFPVLPPPTDADPRAVRERFWAFWLKWKAQGAEMWADCGWPVEARFLAACVDDSPKTRCWEGPYPLHEISEYIGMETYERLPDELPAHHPLHDARQSARKLDEHWECIEDLGGCGWKCTDLGQRPENPVTCPACGPDSGTVWWTVEE